MQHFIGGAAVGFWIFLFFIQPTKVDTGQEALAWFFCAGTVSTLFGIAAWGMLP